MQSRFVCFMALLIAGFGFNLSAQAQDGHELYEQSCQACHATGVAGAPEVGDNALWTELEAKGMDELMQSAINGKGVMPPRGGSNADDDAIRAAIEYMLKESS